MKKSDQQLMLALGLSGLAVYLLFTQSGKDVAAQISEGIMKIADSGLNLIADFESFSPVPYADAMGQSIGFGHFLQPGELGNTIIPPISKAQGYDLLNQDAAIAQTAIDNHVAVPLTQNQHDALLSLIYNIGAANFAGSTLLQYLNQGNYDAAAEQFSVWNKTHINGMLVTSQALADRRSAEQSVFMTA